MARIPRKLHELKPVNRRGGCYVFRNRKWIHLGKWDTRRDEPSPEAAAKLDRYRALWRVDPTAGSVASEQIFLVQLWRDWRLSSMAPRRQSEDAVRAERYLFGTVEEPRPHAYTLVDDFGAPEFLAWQTELCETRNEDGTLRLSRSTIMQMIKQVRSCLSWGVIMGKVDQAQAAMIQLVPAPPRGSVKEKVRRRGVPREVVDAALPHLTPPLRAVVELLWLTCARPSEILELRAGDIARGGKVMTPSAVVLDLSKLRVWAAVLREHKTDDGEHDRVIFFGRRCQRILKPFLEGREPGEFLFRPADGKAARKEIERSMRKPGGYGSYKPRKGESGERQPGECYTDDVLRKAVRRAAKRAGVGHWSPYQIRHSVFREVQKRYGRDAARVYGGHVVGGATEIYAGADLERAAEVARAMG